MSTDRTQLPLHGRHALITGASRGIGAAIARDLDAYGARVTVLGRDRTALESVAATLHDAAVVCADVGDPLAVHKAVAIARAKVGPIGILVCNAGVAPSAPFLRTDPRTWADTIRTNVEGVVHLAHEALPDMLGNSWGRMISIASTAGLRGYPYVSAYCTSKHAVIGLTRALAMEFVHKHITVNAVCPGYVQTKLLEESLDRIVAKTHGTREEATKKLRGVNPQDRFIAPDEVAAAVRWLCLPGSEGVTGQSIALAGGEIM